ncbi:DinB family protein [Paenibacillus dokdonensis]|uniref:DinB family protein n=1 Tax=Paenibacillus dokdonensis TaxID=2567944 RepID=A0ABU6GWQ1_9BACL|nr:DinB family protein [Paenibacillus dokdonensis]MEC0243683.1 DinB family protein [Paenibacillus dokdonensis]
MKVVERLNHWIAEVPVKFNILPEPELSIRPQPHKWSKKEILGHLCDSAQNNLQRFIRAQYEEQPQTVIKYDQEQWVKLMGYQDLPFDQVLSLWVSLNKQVAAVIEKTQENHLQKGYPLSEGQIVTLGWLIDDYVDHLEHHLKQIFGDK